MLETLTESALKHTFICVLCTACTVLIATGVSYSGLNIHMRASVRKVYACPIFFRHSLSVWYAYSQWLDLRTKERRVERQVMSLLPGAGMPYVISCRTTGSNPKAYQNQSRMNRQQCAALK